MVFPGSPAGGGFFFQAEDGIRDKLVTGVQTCALPISDDAARRTKKRDPGSRSLPRVLRAASSGPRARAAGLDRGSRRRAPWRAPVPGRSATRALPQDLRRLRPHVRLLRHSADAREASLGAARTTGA